MRGETMAQSVNRDALAETCGARRFPAGALQRGGIHMMAFAPAGKQPVLQGAVTPLAHRVMRTPPAAQHFQQPWGE